MADVVQPVVDAAGEQAGDGGVGTDPTGILDATKRVITGEAGYQRWIMKHLALVLASTDPLGDELHGMEERVDQDVSHETKKVILVLCASILIESDAETYAQPSGGEADTQADWLEADGKRVLYLARARAKGLIHGNQKVPNASLLGPLRMWLAALARSRYLTRVVMDIADARRAAETGALERAELEQPGGAVPAQVAERLERPIIDPRREPPSPLAFPEPEMGSARRFSIESPAGAEVERPVGGDAPPDAAPRRESPPREERVPFAPGNLELLLQQFIDSPRRGARDDATEVEPDDEIARYHPRTKKGPAKASKRFQSLFTDVFASTESIALAKTLAAIGGLENAGLIDSHGRHTDAAKRLKTVGGNSRVVLIEARGGNGKGLFSWIGKSVDIVTGGSALETVANSNYIDKKTGQNLTVRTVGGLKSDSAAAFGSKADFDFIKGGDPATEPQRRLKAVLRRLEERAEESASLTAADADPEFAHTYLRGVVDGARHALLEADGGELLEVAAQQVGHENIWDFVACYLFLRTSFSALAVQGGCLAGSSWETAISRGSNQFEIGFFKTVARHYSFSRRKVKNASIEDKIQGAVARATAESAVTMVAMQRRMKELERSVARPPGLKAPGDRKPASATKQRAKSLFKRPKDVTTPLAADATSPHADGRAAALAAIKAHAGWRSISAEERRMLIGMGHKGHNLEVECMPSECRGAIVAPVRRAVLCWKKACELGGIDPLSEKYSPKADPLDE